MNQKVKISLIIPTYNQRTKQLLRTVDFIVRQIAREEFEEQAELIIGDGSLFSMEEAVRDFLASKRASRCIRVKYLHMPKASITKRLFRLVMESDSEFVQFCGDEDFPVLESVRASAIFLTLQPAFSASSGFCYNFKFYGKALKLCAGERPYNGFQINSDDPMDRVASLLTLNSVGVAPLFYALQRRTNLVKYVCELESATKTIYGGGSELLHQVMTALDGKICFSDQLALIRDQTYFNYIHPPNREAPASDPIPYYGLDAVEMCSKLMSLKCQISESLAKRILESHLNATWSIQKSRTKVLEAIDKLENFFPIDRELLNIIISTAKDHVQIYKS